MKYFLFEMHVVISDTQQVTRLGTEIATLEIV